MNPLSSGHVVTTASHGDLGSRSTDADERLNNLCLPAQHLIRDISSAYMKADGASRVGDKAEELKRLLYAASAISTLLLFKFDDRIDDCTAYEYATSLMSSAKRIEDMFERGWE